MKYLKIRNWDKFQTHRKDRGTPPWIKVYRNLFTSPEWMQLSDCEKGQLVSFWIAAADQKGKIPNNAKILQKMCMLDREPNLKRFKDLGILVGIIDSQSVDNVASLGCQHDAPETETETETETELKHKGQLADQSSWVTNFEKVWRLYPNKLGKSAALRHYKAQVWATCEHGSILKALENYKAHVATSRSNGHRDLQYQHGSTWFNNRWRDYIDLQVETPPDPEDDWKKGWREMHEEYKKREGGEK